MPVTFLFLIIQLVMKLSFFKTTALGTIVASTLLFSACGKKADDSAVTSEEAISDGPDVVVQTIISEFANGNSGIIWSALPTSYQSDIDGLIHLAGANTDKEVYDKSLSLFARLAEVIDQQKSFIVNSSLLKERSAEDLSQLEAALPSVVGLMTTIASSELSSTEGLLNFDGKTFFETTVSTCVEYLDAIGQLTGDDTKLANYAATVVSVVESDGQQATLSIAVPGQEKKDIVFTKVEECWVPAEIESEWAVNIEQMTASLEVTSAEAFEAQKTQIMGALTMFEGILTQIASVQTQEQFDESLQSAAMPFMSIFMILSQASNAAD
jgi:hypothetical protein